MNLCAPNGCSFSGSATMILLWYYVPIEELFSTESMRFQLNILRHTVNRNCNVVIFYN